MHHYPEQLSTVIRVAGMANVKGWGRIKQAIKLARTLRMFGSTISVTEIISPAERVLINEDTRERRNSLWAKVSKLLTMKRIKKKPRKGVRFEAQA
eukprot:snap_masked-scaffold_10-processed-gene-12.33-mRNA-1 protein AED:1.00 eAED:1.00 QI:0/0/0/0/1/1/2/0/95